jgi:hypothetical protein
MNLDPKVSNIGRLFRYPKNWLAIQIHHCIDSRKSTLDRL